MDEKKDFRVIVEELCEKDTRYQPDGYEFVMKALHHTQQKLKRQGHVTGRELLEGICNYAIEQYGAFAQQVLQHWGISKTDDFGAIVFSMVEHKLLAKTQNDSVEDFKDVFNFETVFGNVLRDSVIKEIG